ncbi:AfsR/SARP family transcriptional regulator [Actinomadura scrupuli]|uniref:AfsR/SARP family transcriptional regulator n=1 Tax=Actinomadura scrupuli TaxID=559629 RepID=UPI003D95EA72
MTDDLDRALLSVQIEIIDRVRRQEETELLGEPDIGAPPPLLLVATPGDARERIEAVLALGRPYGITGLLLEEDRPSLSLDHASDVTAPRADPRRPRAAEVFRAPEAEAQPGRALDVQSRQAPAGLIRLLGRYVVEGGTEQCAGRNKDMWALLGLLAEHRTALLSRRTAEAKIWPDQDAGDHRFPTLIKDTRAKLCDALGRPYDHGKYVIENIGISGYRINPGIYTCDVWQLRDHLAAAAKATGAQRAAALTKAVELRTGPYLPESPYGWALNASRTLDREIVQAFAELARLQSNPERAVSYLEKATSIDSTAEHLYRRRMQAYAGLGRPEAVHHCYEELISHLGPRAKRPERMTIELYETLARQA